MRAMLVGFAMICTALVLVSGPNFAQEKKDEPKTVVLKGTITCAKCDLKLEKKCMTVIVVKDDKTKKDVTYYFDPASHKESHGKICSDAKPGSVEGTVEVKDKKNIVTVKKTTFE